MKEDRLLKKIAEQAKNFKQRALTDPADEKRHDRVQQDEQKWMWIAYKQLLWSSGKIGGAFDRDQRTVKKAVETYQPEKGQIQKSADNQDPHILEARRKHFNDLAQTAKILAHRVERVLRDKDTANIQGNIISGFFFSSKTDGQVLPGWFKERKYDAENQVDPYLAKCLMAHYKNEFGKMPVKEWDQSSPGDINSEIVDNLKFLAYGGLKPCPECPLCHKT